MKVNCTFIMRQINDDYFLIPIGQTMLTVNGMIMLNEVSADIWKLIKEGGDIESITESITEMYEIDAETAKTDVTAFVDKLREMKIIGQ